MLDALSQIFLLSVQIAFLAIPTYYAMLFLRRTRGYRILFSLVAFLLTMYIASRWMHMDEIGWILAKIASYVPFVFLVIFQPELRRLFAELGGRFGARDRISPDDVAGVVSTLTKSLTTMAEKRIGAIVAIEQEENLEPFSIGGRRLNAPVVDELLETIFYPGTALHDGGVILCGNRLMYAGCVFPLGVLEGPRRSFGTRHRAAIGLSERTDAIILVVSEETGAISVAYRGDIVRGIDMGALVKILQAAVGSAGKGGAAGLAFSELRRPVPHATA